MTKYRGFVLTFLVLSCLSLCLLVVRHAEARDSQSGLHTVTLKYIPGITDWLTGHVLGKDVKNFPGILHRVETIEP